MKRLLTLRALARFAGTAILAVAPVAHAQPYWVTLLDQYRPGDHADAPSARENWYSFSPEGRAMPLVLYGIASARQSVDVLAYIITNRQILAALARKARDGVPVTVVVDYNESIAGDRDGYIRRGLDYLAASGATVCATRAFPRMHDKSMVLDRRNVQTGSINYTGAGERENSEDATISWNDLDEAVAFEAHFRSRLETCQPL